MSNRNTQETRRIHEHISEMDTRDQLFRALGSFKQMV